MTEPPHRAVVSRLSADFAAISQQLARVSADLTALDRLLSEQPPAPQPAAPSQPSTASGWYPRPYVPPAVPYWPQYSAHYCAAASTRSPATCAAKAAAGTLWGLDRQSAGRCWCRGHLDRRRVAVGAGGPSRHSAPGVPRRGRSRARRGAGSRRVVVVRQARRAGRRDRAGRHGRRGCVHGRHRRHGDLPLGPCTCRASRRRADRRWRFDPGPALGLPTSRPAGAGAADRARAGGHRRHHAVARRVHAGAVGGIAASAAGHGLDLDACGSHGGHHPPAVGGAGRGLLRLPAQSVADGCMRHRSRVGDRRGADFVALHEKSRCDGTV